MNAAAREISQNNFFSGHLEDIHVSKQLFLQLVLLFSVLASAIAVVYVTNVHRMTFSQMQLVEQDTQELQLQWGQLLLEQASLATPARVERFADEKLHMVIPSDKQIVILRVK